MKEDEDIKSIKTIIKDEKIAKSLRQPVDWYSRPEDFTFVLRSLDAIVLNRETDTYSAVLFWLTKFVLFLNDKVVYFERALNSLSYHMEKLECKVEELSDRDNDLENQEVQEVLELLRNIKRVMDKLSTEESEHGELP